MSIPPHGFSEESPDANNQPEQGEEQPLLSGEPGEDSAAEPVSTASSGIESLPPEAQGDVDGGPLGCCLGMTVGILLSLSIAVISRLYPDLFIHLLGEQFNTVTKVLMALVLIVGAILFGVLGWRIGRHFYREYEPGPRYLRKMAEFEERERAQRRRRRRKTKSSTPQS